jgi:tetratricopeptide (TPR) repeat protein
MHVLGVASQMAGDFLEAREIMTRRIELARQKGDLLTISSEGANLSMVERQLGNLEEAETLIREALDIAARRGDGLMTGWMMNGLAAVARDLGQYSRAATIIGAADAALEAAGGAWPPDELVHYEQTLATLTEKMGEAEFQRVRAAGHSMTTAEAVDFALMPAQQDS